MELLEAIVNHHADEKKNTAHNAREAARNERIRQHLCRVKIAICVAIACLLATLLHLMHPGLAVLVMLAFLMWGCYHLGRCVRFGKVVR